jgi:hypothetical protein
VTMMPHEDDSTASFFFQQCSRLQPSWPSRTRRRRRRRRKVRRMPHVKKGRSSASCSGRGNDGARRKRPTEDLKPSAVQTLIIHSILLPFIKKRSLSYKKILHTILNGTHTRHLYLCAPKSSVRTLWLLN